MVGGFVYVDVVLWWVVEWLGVLFWLILGVWWIGED